MSEMGGTAARPTLLALGAHYDDCVFGIPGIMLKALRKGYRVVIVAMIGDYANWAPAQGREREILDGTVTICREYGAELRYMDFASHRYEVTDETKRAVAEVVAELQPDIAFHLWPHDRHRDHVVAAPLSTVALRQAGALLNRSYRPPRRVYAYDNGPGHTIGFVPDTYVDVTEEWPEAMEWLARFMRLAFRRPFAPDAPEGPLLTKHTLAAYRGAECRVRYAEAVQAQDRYPLEIL